MQHWHAHLLLYYSSIQLTKVDILHSENIHRPHMPHGALLFANGRGMLITLLLSRVHTCPDENCFLQGVEI
jgi:hypothetical protein